MQIPNDSWTEYRKYVLSELSNLSTGVVNLDSKVTLLNEEFINIRNELSNLNNKIRDDEARRKEEESRHREELMAKIKGRWAVAVAAMSAFVSGLTALLISIFI
jgi:hypothetical protein